MRGRIEKALSGFYYVNTGKDDTLRCRARGRFRRQGISPLVGDWARVTAVGSGEGVLEELEPRRNAFDRPAVSNVDQMVIIASGAIPVTAPFLIDRIAAIAALKQCDVLVVINKTDLDQADALFAIYRAAGIPVLRVSAETGQGLHELQAAISGKLNAFTGNSGVGKSSILNALCPHLALPVGEVSKALGRGRHTTRHVELYALGRDTYVVDTPGFSSFETEDLQLDLKERLPETFLEFLPYLGQCRFHGCSHVKEQGCAVLDAVSSGSIPCSRHKSYVRLYEELKHIREWDKKNTGAK